MTVFSCIASRSADCVFGVARFISSAKTKLAKSGPDWKRKARCPSMPSSMIFVPVISAGIRSGVNWIRLNFNFRAWPNVRINIVLPRPGTPSMRIWPPLNTPTSTCLTTSFWPTITRPISSSISDVIFRNSSVDISLFSLIRHSYGSSEVK